MSESTGSSGTGYTLANMTAQDMGTNQAGQALPLFWGTREFTLHYITPIWNQRVEPTGTSRKGENVTTGFSRWGSFAGALCVGEVYKLSKIRCQDAEDADNWIGNMYASSADEAGVSLVTLTQGTIRFHWGSLGQQPDSVLRQNWINMPAMPLWCYVVAPDCFFGQSTSPPTMKFTISRKAPSWPGSAFIDSQEANMAEVLWDILVNKIYGVGINPDRLDEASFSAARTTLASEGLGLSPLVSDFQDLESFISDSMRLIRGVMTWKNGKLGLKLNRPADTVSMVLSMANMTDEPIIERKGWADTFCETQLTYKNREIDYEDDYTAFRDPANYNITSTATRQELNEDWVTNESAAAQLVRFYGQERAVPEAILTVDLTAEARNLHPGDYVSMNYPPLSITGMKARVTELEVGNPKDLVVRLTAAIEAVTVGTQSYIPEPYPLIDPVKPFIENMITRIGWLPTELKDGKPSGFFACSSRRNSYTGSSSIYVSTNGGQSYGRVGSGLSMGIAMNVQRWRTYGSRVLIRAQIVSCPVEEGILTDALTNYTGLTFICGVVDSANHEIMTCSWARSPVGGIMQKVGTLTWEFELETGLYGSPAISLETGVRVGLWLYGASGSHWAFIYPSADMNFEAPASLFYVKNQAITLHGVEALADAETLYSNGGGGGQPSFSKPWTNGEATSNQEFRVKCMQAADYWPLDGTAEDIVGSHDATASPALVTQAGSPLLGGSLATVLDATHSLTVAAGIAAFQSGADGWMDCWFCPATAPNPLDATLRVIFGQEGDFFVGTHNGVFCVARYGSKIGLFHGTTAPQVGVWYHLGFRYEHTDAERLLALCVNGIREKQDFAGTSTANTNAITFGVPGITFGTLTTATINGAIAHATRGLGTTDFMHRWYLATNRWWDGCPNEVIPPPPEPTTPDPSPLLVSLRSYYHLDGDGTDAGTNELDLQSSGTQIWATGKNGQGLDVTAGGAQYLMLASPGLALNDKSYTISFWCKMTSTTDQGLIAWTGYGGVGVRTSGGLFQAFHYSGQWAVFTHQTPIVIGQWFHVVLRYDYPGYRLTLWVNGVVGSTGANPDPAAVASSPMLQIPFRDWYTTRSIIDEVGVWYRPITDEEVATLAAGTAGSFHPFPTS